MCIFDFFILSVVIVACVSALIGSCKSNIGLFVSSVFIIVLVICFTPLIKEEPRSIDVYRGKTTLQITYQDSIPIDTVVVFK
jgi:hypothetical protein